jgi:hypothetical protein
MNVLLMWIWISVQNQSASKTNHFQFFGSKDDLACFSSEHHQFRLELLVRHMAHLPASSCSHLDLVNEMHHTNSFPTKQ